MYVCPNCGARYENETVFCASCGTKVVAEQISAAPVVPAAPAASEPVLVTLLSFGTKLIHVLTGFFAAMALALPYITTSIRSTKYSYYASTYYNPNEVFSVFAIIMSLLGMGAAAATLVLTLIKRTDLKTKFSGITNVVVGFLLFVLSIALVSSM